jgi:hypothetical protein
MPRYLFDVHAHSWINDEEGTYFLSDDAALAFGRKVIRELREDSGHCDGWSMKITEGGRIVASIPFNLDGLRESKDVKRGILRRSG